MSSAEIYPMDCITRSSTVDNSLAEVTITPPSATPGLVQYLALKSAENSRDCKQPGKVYRILTFFRSGPSILPTITRGTLCLLSLIYRHVILLSLPSHYRRRTERLLFALSFGANDFIRPWSEDGAAIDNARKEWSAFRKFLLRERELVLGACLSICGAGIAILQISSFTETPIIKMVGVWSVIVAMNGTLTSLNQHRHLGCLESLEAAFSLASDISRLKDARFFAVHALLAGPAARLTWSVILLLLFFLLSAAWPLESTSAQTHIATGSSREANFAASGDRMSASDCSNFTATFSARQSVMLGLILALCIAHSIASSYHFARLGCKNITELIDSSESPTVIGEDASPSPTAPNIIEEANVDGDVERFRVETPVGLAL